MIVPIYIWSKQTASTSIATGRPIRREQPFCTFTPEPYQRIERDDGTVVEHLHGEEPFHTLDITGAIYVKPLAAGGKTLLKTPRHKILDAMMALNFARANEPGFRFVTGGVIESVAPSNIEPAPTEVAPSNPSPAPTVEPPSKPSNRRTKKVGPYQPSLFGDDD